MLYEVITKTESSDLLLFMDVRIVTMVYQLYEDFYSRAFSTLFRHIFVITSYSIHYTKLYEGDILDRTDGSQRLPERVIQGLVAGLDIPYFSAVACNPGYGFIACIKKTAQDFMVIFNIFRNINIGSVIRMNFFQKCPPRNIHRIIRQSEYPAHHSGSVKLPADMVVFLV